MELSMRKLLLNIHLYIGLTAAVVMMILAITGTFLVFEPNIDHYLNAGMDYVQPGEIPISLDRLRDSLEQKFPGYLVTEIILPERPTSSTVFHLDSPALHKSKELYADQWTGKILGLGSQRNRLTKKVRLLHTQLLGGVIGNEVITWSTAGLAVLGVTGLVLWWPRKVLTIKRRSSLPRLNNDLHHSLGFWTSWTMLLFSATGLLIHASRTPDADPFGSTQAKTADAHSRVSISEILSCAQQTLPSGTLTRVDFSLDSSAPVSVTVRLPEDHTPLGRSSVKLDPSDARVLQVSSTRSAPVRFKLSKLWAREIHTGDIYGWPSRILAALCSFALALLALSGPMIWLNKKIAAQRGRRAFIEREREREAVSALRRPSATSWRRSMLRLDSRTRTLPPE
jgi:uncharacterized iron-regulated membrane protein